MITIVELAKLAGVSDATVSLVLSGKERGRVGDVKRKKILELARAHGYRTNFAAKALAEGRTYRIAVCTLGKLIQHAIIGEFSLYVRLGLAVETLRAEGYAIEIAQIDANQTSERIAQELCQEAVDGFVFLSWPLSVLEKPLLCLKEKGLPAVASGTRFPSGDFTWTDMDHRQVFIHATRQLLREGRKRVFLIDTVIPRCPPSTIEGFAEGLAAPSPRWLSKRILRPEVLSPECIRRSTRDFVRRSAPVEAIVLSDNYYAQAVLDALKSMRIRIGTGCRVIGYGDRIFAEQCSPQLSHYSLGLEEQVRFGIHALLMQIEQPQTYTPRRLDMTPTYVQLDT
jgi:DNA-binding LacI/PurR family transcriptional regulator